MASSIQFKGIDGVVDAYDNREVAAWSLWQGKQFMFKYEGSSIEDGATQLRSTLELLQQSTNAIYTLKVYEDVPGGKIKSNTPDDGSFNFKINADEQLPTQSQLTSYRNNNEVIQRLEAIEQRLTEEPEEEKEPENKLGLIGEIIGNPALQPYVQSFFTSLLGSMFKTPAAATPQLPRAAINGINSDGGSTSSNNSDEDLQAAVIELKKYDDRLAEHLRKLATIAQTNNDSFKFLLSTLDSM